MGGDELIERRVTKLVLAATVALIAGCGGGGGGGGLVKQPKATQPIAGAEAAYNKAVKDQSCDEVMRITFSQLREKGIPGGPATAAECTHAKRQLHIEKGRTYTKAATYGTAAILQGAPVKNPPKGAPKGVPVVPQALFVLDRDGKYRFIVSAVDKTQIGVKPSAGAVDHGKNARAVIAAVRAKDCKKLVPLIHPGAVQVLGGTGATPQKYCDSYVHGKIFSPAIQATKDAKPVLMGQTRDFAFYGVSTKKGYFTMVMITPPGTSDKPPLMFGIFLNTHNPALPG